MVRHSHLSRIGPGGVLFKQNVLGFLYLLSHGRQAFREPIDLKFKNITLGYIDVVGFLPRRNPLKIEYGECRSEKALQNIRSERKAQAGAGCDDLGSHFHRDFSSDGTFYAMVYDLHRSDGSRPAFDAPRPRGSSGLLSAPAFEQSLYRSLPRRV